MAVEVDDPTNVQDAYDKRFNDIHAAEQNASDGSYADESATDSADGVREQEESPGWQNKFTGNSGGGSQSFSSRATKFARKYGPTGAIGGVIATIGIGGTMLLSPSLLLVHIKEAVLDRFSHQNTVLDRRTNRIMANKLSSAATSGCAVASPKIFCKFNRMSNKMLQRMSDNGMIPVDKNGKVLDIKKSGVWGQKPYGFINPSGELNIPVDSSGKQILKATEFRTFVRDNPIGAKVFRRAFNPRWEMFWDSVYDGFLKKVGFGTKSKKITGDDEKSVKESFDKRVDEISGDKTTLGADEKNSNDKNAAESNADSQNTASEANSGIDEAGSKSTDELAKSMTGKVKGGAAIFISLYCTALQADKISKALKAIQMAQLISFGLLFLQLADEIKLTNTDDPVPPAKVSTVATMFTGALIASNGTVTKKSALSSDTALYALVGNTSFASKTSDYSRWVPGGGLVKILYKITAALKTGNGQVDGALSKVCDAFNSTAGQLVALAINFSPAGAIIFAATEVAMRLPVVQNAMASLFKNLAGKVIDKTLAFEDFGNASFSGIVQAIVEGANAGAMMPLSTAQAVAYSKAERQTQLADAAIDRATLSPFDVSSPNTFMGSIVTQLIPYSAGITSGPLSTVGAIGGIVSSTFSSMLTPRTFALGANDGSITEADLSRCEDPAIKEAGIAAGPICDTYYAVPLEYLDAIDPAENVAWMQSHKQIEDDGTIISGSDLDEFLNGKNGEPGCMSGTGEGANINCVIDSTTKARYALYFIDKRLQVAMDDEDTGSTTAEPTTSTPTGSSDGWVLPVAGATPSLGWHQSARKGLHKGIDFPGPRGTDVVAAHSGTVTLRYNMGACGWATVIQVDGESNLYMGYQHVDTTVRVGDHVDKGQKIGVIGKFCGTGFHAHLSIETANRVSAYADSGSRDTSVDPKKYLPL